MADYHDANIRKHCRSMDLGSNWDADEGEAVDRNEVLDRQRLMDQKEKVDKRSHSLLHDYLTTESVVEVAFARRRVRDAVLTLTTEGTSSGCRRPSRRLRARVDQQRIHIVQVNIAFTSILIPSKHTINGFVELGATTFINAAGVNPYIWIRAGRGQSAALLYLGEG